jgi:hypothetical protein
MTFERWRDRMLAAPLRGGVLPVAQLVPRVLPLTPSAAFDLVEVAAAKSLGSEWTAASLSTISRSPAKETGHRRTPMSGSE